MKNIAYLSLFALVLICWGCEHDSSTNFVSDVSVNVENVAYIFDSGQRPLVTLRNDSKHYVYLGLGSFVGFEQFKYGQWINFTDWFAIFGNVPYQSLAPGKSITHDLPFDYFQLEEIPGTYRFKFFVYRDTELSTLLPLNQRVSQPFEVKK